MVISDRGWILERLAKEIADRISGVTYDTEPNTSAALNYYVTYGCRKERASPIEVALFTHIEDEANARAKFIRTAKDVDACIAMSEATATILKEIGIESPAVILPGVDLDRFVPKLRVGVVGRTYHTGRKGEALVNAVMDVPGIEWVFTGDGWPEAGHRVDEADLPAFYRTLDYVLVPALNEGGPMCVLEALASGVPVIGSDVGWVPDFPHHAFEKGNADSLRALLVRLLGEKMALRESVLAVTWDRWAGEHDRLFRKLLAERGIGGGTTVAAPAVRPYKSVALVTAGLESTIVGGPSVRVPKTAALMRDRGTRAEALSFPTSKLTGFDLVHAYNIWPPASAARIARRAAALGKPFVFSPILLDLSEAPYWQHEVMRTARKVEAPEDARAIFAEARRLHLVDRPGARAIEEPEPGYLGGLREIGEIADAVVYLSEYERKLYRRLSPSEPAISRLIVNPVDAAHFADGDPDMFREAHGLGDYVLCVARVEHRKNQLMLAIAAREAGLPLVLVGHAGDEAYANHVRRLGGPDLVMVNRLDPGSPMLRSAIAGARVVTLPSWAEGAPLAALEAGAAGARLLLSDRSSEREYFGDHARYCDPSDPDSIRDELVAMWDLSGREGRHDAALAEHVRTTFSWERHVDSTLDLYREVREARGEGRVPTAAARLATVETRPALAAGAPVRIVLDITTMSNNATLRSGIVRVEAALARELPGVADTEIRFVAWRNSAIGFVEVPAVVARGGRVKDFANSGLAQVVKPDASWRGARFVVVGSSWMQNAEYAQSIVGFARAAEAELCVLMHDLTPYLFPAWFADGYSEPFVRNMSTLFSKVDRLLVYSENTREDSIRAALDIDLDLAPTQKIRLADDIGTFATALSASGLAIQEKFGRRPFVLSTGAIHARKNYGLLYDVWSILRDKMGDACPHLVIVGGVSWNGGELARTMRLDRTVNRFIHILTDVDDSALDWLYRNCLMTAYPSLYEGWGLPVGESLAYGKICVASNRSSVPEIAPTVTDLIDPLDRVEWAARIMHYAGSASARAAREAQIRDTYRQTTWADTSRDLVTVLREPTTTRQRNRYTLGELVLLSDGIGAARFLEGGWSQPEAWGTWVVDASPRVRLQLDRRPTSDLVLHMMARVLAPPQFEVAYTVVANGTKVADWRYRNPVTVPAGHTPHVLNIAAIPADLVGDDGVLVLEFVASRIFKVAEVIGGSTDPRNLGLGVVAFAVQAKPHATTGYDLAYQLDVRKAVGLDVPLENAMRHSPVRPALPIGEWVFGGSAAAKVVVANPAMAAATYAFTPVNGTVTFTGGLPFLDPAQETCRLRVLVAPGSAAAADCDVLVHVNGEIVAERRFEAEGVAELHVDVPFALLAARSPATISVFLVDGPAAGDKGTSLLAVRLDPGVSGAPGLPITRDAPHLPDSAHADRVLDGAWYGSEGHRVWSVGDCGRLVYRVDLAEGGSEFLLLRLGAVVDGAEGDEIFVEIDGQALAPLPVPAGAVGGVDLGEVLVPLGGLLPPGRRRVEIGLRRGRRTAPLLLGLSADARELGVMFKGARLDGCMPGESLVGLDDGEPAERARRYQAAYLELLERPRLVVDVSALGDGVEAPGAAAAIATALARRSVQGLRPVLARRDGRGYVAATAGPDAEVIDLRPGDRVLLVLEGGPTEDNLAALSDVLALRCGKGLVVVEPAADGFPWRLDSNLLRDGAWLGAVDGIVPDLSMWPGLPTGGRSVALDVHRVRVLDAEEGGIAEVAVEVAEALAGAVAAAGAELDPDRYGTATYFATSPRLQTQCGRREGGMIRSSERAGYLVFGPYVPVGSGRYDVEIYGEGDAATFSDCVADVSARQGTLTLAAAGLAVLAEGVDAKGGLVARLAVEIEEPVDDLEVRVFVKADSVVDFRCMRIVRRGDLEAPAAVEVEPQEPADLGVDADFEGDLA
ncbi:glycosyltransferase family 4 protein [Oharaeibacter diazotrophicus]|uniref:glycosyltransferase family 4 protein n=2 Tax=Oharaeibacter diazotrophicus TaxID=1920512 RepID=UPI000F81A344|nr:glycosyltransferase [Oharaeibacter diazotrophicus]GLS78912.1 hypothetical protein GCM10007904_42490 [Oharaeibacter diazotrophicus]